MTRQTWIIAVLVLGMIAGAAMRLHTAGARQRLGVPGVRIAEEPIYAHDGVSTNAPSLLHSNRVFLPPRVLDYASASGYIAPITAQTLPTNTMYGHRVYTNGMRLIDYQVVLMGSDRSSIHKPQGCLQGTGWQTISSDEEMIPVQGAISYDLPVRKLKLRRQVQLPDGKVKDESAVFVYWFVADGQITSGHLQRMWWMARDLLTQGVLQRWAYIITFANCEPGNEDKTFTEMKSFIAASAPEFLIVAGQNARHADARAN
jgi:hypothetical protein